jgi:EAL domain-containing protein (putative c-di-GMP-specific phosphodiesterase class I)
VAEENGVIFEISDWVLREACWNAMSWDNKLWVSVNLSPVEFQRHDLVQRIQRVLEETGLSAERLELEITENIMREDSEAILTTMSDLKALGVRLSMDNFGTDYSSLGYLQSYPFDGIKIDRSFLMYLDHSERHEAVVDAIIRMGHALSLNVTVGGVETTEQLERVSSLSCDQVQGFYLGPPVSPASFKELLCDDVSR